MAEEFCRDNRSRAEAETQTRSEMEKTLGSLKHDHFELTEKFKESEKRRKSAEAGLKSAETQAEDQCKELYSTQINLAPRSRQCWISRLLCKKLRMSCSGSKRRLS